MRKIILIFMLITVLNACAAYEPAVVGAGVPYNIVGSEITLNGDVLRVHNTYNEESARIQLDVTYYGGGEVLGSFVTVGTALMADKYHDYKLVIPEGTESLKVHYAEYKNKGGGLLINTPTVSRSGAVIFTLTK